MFINVKRTKNSREIAVYLDFATLPSINMIFDLLNNRHDEKIERIVGFSRFELNEEIIEQFPKGKLHFYKTEKVNSITSFAKEILNIIVNSHEMISLTIHTNLTHSLITIPKLIKILNSANKKFYIKHLYLYDDGTSDYTDLYNMRDNNLTHLFLNAKKNLKIKFKTEIGSHSKYKYAREIYRIIRKYQFLHHRFHFSFLNKYTWHNLFPTTYILLCPEYFWLDDKMAPIKKELSSIYKKFDFKQFDNLSEENKILFLKIINLDNNQLIHLKKVLKEDNAIILTGTTTWNEDPQNRLAFAETLISILSNLVNDNELINSSKIFFKGHPAAKDINQLIINELKIESIPENIPLETLMMLDMLPKSIAGIMSSIYLSLPKEKIGKIIFLDDYSKDSHDKRLINFPKLMSILNKYE